MSEDNTEDKITKSAGKLLSMLCGFICSTIPCFFIIKYGCDTGGCNSLLGWIFSLGPMVLSICCIIMILSFSIMALGENIKKVE